MMTKHPQLGTAWVCIEMTVNGETRGLARCAETGRIVV